MAVPDPEHAPTELAHSRGGETSRTLANSRACRHFACTFLVRSFYALACKSGKAFWSQVVGKSIIHRALSVATSRNSEFFESPTFIICHPTFNHLQGPRHSEIKLPYSVTFNLAHHQADTLSFTNSRVYCAVDLGSIGLPLLRSISSPCKDLHGTTSTTPVCYCD